jgi:hypothetical protein
MSSTKKKANKLYDKLNEEVWRKLQLSTIEIEDDIVYFIDGSGPYVERIPIAELYPQNLIIALQKIEGTH